MNNLVAFDIANEFIVPFNRNELGVADLVSWFLSSAIIVSGVVFVIGVILGGINFIKASGSGNASDLQKSQKTIIGAGIGLLLVSSAYVILQIIEKIFFQGQSVLI